MNPEDQLVWRSVTDPELKNLPEGTEVILRSRQWKTHRARKTAFGWYLIDARVEDHWNDITHWRTLSEDEK